MADLFSGIAQWDTTLAGRSGKLPVFYQDASSVTAVFPARAEVARRLVPHPALRLVELYPGRCLVAITAFEYRRTDIDPYNELSIAFLASAGSRPVPGLSVLSLLARRTFGAYVWQLPVTTEVARVGGVDLYGFPKFIADIRFERAGGKIGCRLAAGGKPILALRGRTLPTRPGPRTRYVTYSVRKGILLAANVLVDPLEYAESLSGGGAELELHGDHAICATLRELDLGRRAVLYQYAARMQAILFAPRNLVDC